VGQVKYNDVGGDLKTGTPTVTIAGGVATFSEAQTGNIGVGDRVTYGTTGVVYISGRTSQTVWNVITATGTQPIATTSATVNSIGHEFKSLVSALESGSFNSSHMNTYDLVAGNYILNIPCYYDSGPDTQGVYMLTSATTSASNYVRVYTATSTNEVNRSQRHTGKWSNSAYRLEINNNNGIGLTQINFLKIDGLQIYITANSLYKYGIVLKGKLITDTTDFKISNNIIKGLLTGGATNSSGISLGS
jgi:hypothetical protein